MAARGAGVLLARTCNFIANPLFRESQFMPRVLTQCQFVRQRKRTSRPAPWHAPKRIVPFWDKRELTWENQEFLKEVAQDSYQPIVQSPLREALPERNQWTKRTLRTGVLGIKIGVIPQWTKDGKKFHTTMIQVLDNHVINYVPPEEYAKRIGQGYKEEWKWRRDLGMVVVGALSAEPFNYTKAYCNLFKKAGVPPKRKLTRFIVTPDAAVQPGTPLLATHFQVGHYVDVQAKTIGHGFQGVVKRWGFKGGPASHGATKFQRRPGSVGGGGDKGGIWKGKKMPGHMGMDWRPLRGLKIWRINTKYNILYLMGPNLPGPSHCYVRIMDSTLYHNREFMESDPESLPHMPTFYPTDDIPEDGLPEELFHQDLFQFTQPSITYAEEEEKVVKGRR